VPPGAVPGARPHGSGDRCQPVARGRRLAELTGGDMVLLEDAGHLPQSRDPVKVTRLITESPTRSTGAPMHATHLDSRSVPPETGPVPVLPDRARARPRDIAVARELKRLRPGLEIDWLAQHPVTTVLDAEGEHVHPASQWLASESAHVVSEASGHDLHCFQALRRMDEIPGGQLMVFQEVVEEGAYDLVIGDEAWDVD